MKWILQYLLKTLNVGLVFKRDDTCNQYAIVYVDSHYAGDLDKWRSISDYVFTLVGAPVFRVRTKHIHVRYYFVWEIISEGRILLQKIGIAENLADMLTMVVTTIKFNHCLDLIEIPKV